MRFFLRYLNPYLKEFRKKTTENSEWLRRQTQPGIEPDNPRLTVLRAEPPAICYISSTLSFEILYLFQLAAPIPPGSKNLNERDPPRID